MRKMLVPVAALLLCAAPAAAQQAVAPSEPATPAPVQAEERQAPRTPALYPSTDEVRQQVRANEERLGREQAPIGNRDWWYLVAAIAVGVIIAAVLL
jgi:hypothetical protein